MTTSETMTMARTIEATPAAQTAAIVTSWVRMRTCGDLPPRRNLRVVFGDEHVVHETRRQLESFNNERCWYVVRSSSDGDAVRLRNGRPEEAPAGVSLVYVLFWCPGSSAHDKNAQSLSDLQPVDVGDVLGQPGEFVLDAERVIQEQCRAAALAWPLAQQDRAREHLLAAFEAVRQCLRVHRGGRQRSVPFVANLAHYARYLDDIRLPDARPEPVDMLRRWGERLSVFGLFSLPALASVLGVRTDPNKAIESPSRTGERGWAGDLAALLADNLEQAMDHPRLGDLIAGKSTLLERLEKGVQATALTSGDESNNRQAMQALAAFCEHGELDALEKVEWLFYKDPANRRSPSLGLRGLLLALGKRKTRRSPEDAAYEDTLALLLTFFPEGSLDAEAVRTWVASLRDRVSRSPASADDVAHILHTLHDENIPEGDLCAPVRSQLGVVAAQASREHRERLLKLSKDWEKLFVIDIDKSIESTSLLRGLALLLLRNASADSESPAPRLRLEGSSPQDQLKLVLADGNGRTELKVPFSGWGPDDLERISQWLRDDVRAARLRESPVALYVEEDEEQEEEPIRIEVLRVHGSTPKSLGGLHLYGKPRARQAVAHSLTDSLKSWSVTVPSADVRRVAARVAELLQPSDMPPLDAQGEALSGSSLPQRWRDVYRSDQRGGGSDLMALLAPVSRAAQAWTEAWFRALGEQRSAPAPVRGRPLEELQRLMQEAMARGDMPGMQQLMAEMTSGPTNSLPSQAVEATRTLLRIGTVTLNEDGDRPRAHVALLPYHPMVLHLQTLSDRLLGQCIRTLLVEGWPAVAEGDLQRWLDDWGLPAPAQTYGFWEGSPPLSFDGWLEGPLALFSRHDGTMEADAGSLGASEVAGILKRYGQLFPASGDRLRMLILGDREGAWASRVLTQRLEDGDDGPSFAADVEMVTDLPERELSALEKDALASTDLLAAFEPGPEGTSPRVRARRVSQGDSSPKHLSLVIGEQIKEFRPSLSTTPVPASPPSAGLWEPSSLLLEPTPELSGYHLSTGEREDATGQAIGAAVGVACGSPGCLFRRQFSFDPTRCVAPLRQHQGGAHWLVMASRQPIYRALQVAGAELTTLLDFFSSTERGRPLYVCVGLNAAHGAHDQRRLASSLRALVGGEGGEPTVLARSLMRAALGVAPGLAMQCVGASSLTHLEGLLGLLLTVQATQRQYPHKLLLSLDQHASLLDDRGRSGRGRGGAVRATRADLLALWIENGRVVVAPIESKFTTLRPGESLVRKAATQIQETQHKLAYLSVPHPLALRSRRRLLQAVVRQAHLLGDRAPGRLASASALAQALERPETQVEVRSLGSDSIHVWSLASEAAPGPGTWMMHDRAQTLVALRELESTAS